jgi:hypothetical protein
VAGFGSVATAVASAKGPRTGVGDLVRKGVDAREAPVVAPKITLREPQRQGRRLRGARVGQWAGEDRDQRTGTTVRHLAAWLALFCSQRPRAAIL